MKGNHQERKFYAYSEKWYSRMDHEMPRILLRYVIQPSGNFNTIETSNEYHAKLLIRGLRRRGIEVIEGLPSKISKIEKRSHPLISKFSCGQDILILRNSFNSDFFGKN